MKKHVICAAGVLMLSGVGGASTLQWDQAPDQAPGDLGPITYSVDGIDIDVAVLDPDGRLTTSPSLPDDDNPYGFSGMWIAGDFASPHDGAAISITLAFSVPVSGVSFSVYDIDGRSGIIDTVDVDGRLGAGPSVALTGVSMGSAVIWDGAWGFAADGTFDSDPPVAQHTASLQFDGTVDFVSVSLSSNANSRGILLGDVTFVPAPGGFAILASALGVVVPRRRSDVRGRVGARS